MNPIILAGAALGGYLMLKKRRNPRRRRNPSSRKWRSAALKRAIAMRKKWYKLAQKTVTARTGLTTMPGLQDNYSPAHARWMKQVKKVRRLAGYGTGLTNFMRERGRRAVVGNNPPCRVYVPPTASMGSYVTNAKSRADALWDYNNARAHDGLKPVKRLPRGTKFTRKNPRYARPGENEIPTVRIIRKRNPRKVYDPISRKMVRVKSCKVLMGGTVKRRRGGIPGVKGADGVWRRNPLNIGTSPLATIHGTIGINPRRKRRGRCAATPGAAAARLAKWRWHHNPTRDIRTGPPRPVPLPDHYWSGQGKRPWCVVGTAYGYLHRTDGMVRTFKSRSGAAKAAKRYVAL